MDKESPEYKRVRGEITRIIESYDSTKSIDCYPDSPDINCPICNTVDQILSIKGIAILADEQVFPDRVYINEDNKDEELELSGHTQIDMLKANFRRVI